MPVRLRLNVLAPGATSTPGLHGLATGEKKGKALVTAIEAATPLGRLDDPGKIASAALFLVSNESSFINGTELFADGGAAQI